METQLNSLSKIFTERLFRIPDYQRGYAWTELQLKDFWNDISQLEVGKNHYTGVLTLEEAPTEITAGWQEDQWIIDSKSFKPFYVVDGQQRLTTSIILIQAIIDRLNENEKLNYTSKIEIQKKFIFDSKDDGISRSYIFGYEKDNPSYEYLKTKIFLEHSSSASDIRETIYTNNLESAKSFFSEKIKELDLQEVELVFKKVTQNLLFNIFTIEEDVDVCVAFETMNNRGKPLSYLELLKNRLIYLSLKLNCQESDKQALRKLINDCWKSIYHQLGRNKRAPLDDDEFLLNHFIIYFGHEAFGDESLSESIRFRRLYRADYASFLLEEKYITKNVLSKEGEEDHLSLRDLHQYVKSLQDSVETWYEVFNPDDSTFSPDIRIWLDKLSRLGFRSFAPLVMVFFQRDSDEKPRISLLKAIERHVFIRLIADYHAHFYYDNLSFLQIASELSSKKIDSIKAIRLVNESSQKIESEGDFKKQIRSLFKNHGFYKWNGIRYLLYEYNLDIQQKSKSERKKIFWPEFCEPKEDFISVEHIYPQRARDDYWKSRFDKFDAKQRRALRDSLGNLLPLSKPKNSSLQNRPFPDKVDGKKDEYVGFRYGSHSENEVAKESDWTADIILSRGLKMLNFVEKRWNLGLGDESSKKTILGLDFLGKKGTTRQ